MVKGVLTMENKIAYKGFNLNDRNELVCRDMVFRVGEIAQVSGELNLCRNGIHFCWNLNDINDYYNLRDSVICEVEILGDIVNQEDMKKSCTNRLKVLRVLTKEEVWKISNTGHDNTGYINTGNCNTGDCNTGNCNTGDCNTGNCNAGDWNTGNYNAGNYNAGNRNTGKWNTGDCNTGDWNTGKCNTGKWNTGNCNTGDWNTGNWNIGFFNTEENKCFIFDKLSNMTVQEFKNSKYYRAICSSNFILTQWIEYTNEEKRADKAKELIKGYLKQYDYKYACAEWWKQLSEESRNTIKSMPNFDAKKFFEITNIRV